MASLNHPSGPALGSGASTLSSGKKKAWVAIGSTLIMVVSVVVVVLYLIRHQRPESRADGRSGPVTPSVASLSSDEKQQAYKNDVTELQNRLIRLRSYLDGFPKALTEVNALAMTLTTPQAAFEFVRDKIALEPYPGIMKGARATLITRGGNSLDRSLLLAAILKQNGVSARIAHGKLTADQAQKLLQQVAAGPDAIGEILQSLPPHASPSNLTDPQKEIKRRIVDQGKEAAKTFNDDLERTLPILQGGLQQAGALHGTGATSRQLEILQDHYWVTAVIAGRPTDLDPSETRATVNTRLTTAIETFDPDALADSLFQHLKFRLVGEFLEDGQVQSTELLSKEAKAPDLFGKNLRLAVVPSSSLANEEQFQTLLMLGDEQTSGQELRLSGEVNAGDEQAAGQGSEVNVGTTKAVGGLLGGLGGDDDATATPPPKPKATPKPTAVGRVLARLYWEVISSGPHLADTPYQRVIFDRLAPSASKLEIQPAFSDDVARKLLIQVWDGTISVGSSTPVYNLSQRLATLEGQESAEEKALARVYLGENFGENNLPRIALAPELIEYFFSSDMARHFLARRHALKVMSYYQRPRLALLRHGYVVGDWSRPQDAPRFADGIDLLNSPFQFVGDSNDAQRFAMESGILDTALERLTVRPDQSVNTIPLFAAASAQGVSIRTLAAGQTSALDNIDVPSSIRSVLAGELAQGRTIILPAHLVKLGDVQTFGWWSLDPDTGLTIGKMELGGAQGLAEQAGLRKVTGKLSKAFAWFYGGLLRCYMNAESDSLAGAADVSEKLAECVIEKSCDFLGELIVMAGTPAVLEWASAEEVEEDIKMEEELIVEFAAEELGEYRAGETAGAVCQALANGGGAGNGSGGKE